MSKEIDNKKIYGICEITFSTNVPSIERLLLDDLDDEQRKLDEFRKSIAH